MGLGACPVMNYSSYNSSFFSHVSSKTDQNHHSHLQVLLNLVGGALHLVGGALGLAGRFALELLRLALGLARQLVDLALGLALELLSLALSLARCVGNGLLDLLGDVGCGLVLVDGCPDTTNEPESGGE